MSQIYAAIDLEMTGLKPGFDEIIEVGVVRCTPERVLDRWSTLVRPLEMPPLRVQRMTGIAPSMLAGAPAWDEVEGRLREMIDGATLIGHNVPFDERFLEAAGIDLSRPSIDTLPLAQIVDPAAPSHRLGALCSRYGIEIDAAHRALADAEAARRLYLELASRFERLPADARDALSELSSSASVFWTPGRVLQDWSLSRANGSAPTQSGRTSARAPGLAPVDLPRGSLEELVRTAFDSAADADFEQRDEQLAMAQDVANTLQHGGTLIVEAGTGTGKSLAYLVPAAFWALKTGSTVVVSTHTINLQQQLEGKDVEFARRLIAGVSTEAAQALKATVVKGRDNYLCRQSLDRELGRVADWEDPLLLARAAVWRTLTQRGDRSELRLPTPMLARWERLSARNTGCLSDRTCRYAINGSCFLLQTQRRAAASHIVIANHALLVRALTSGAITMPEAPVVIVDESHALEDVATDQLTLQMSESWINEPLQRGTEGPDSLMRRSTQAGLTAESQRLKQHVGQSKEALERFYDRLASFASEHAEGRTGNEDRVILSPGSRNSRAWSELEILWEETKATLSAYGSSIEAIGDAGAEQARESQGDEERELDSVTLEARNLLDDFSTRTKQLSRAVLEPSSEEVAWVTREHRKSGEASVQAAPLNVSSHLQPLWTDLHAAVLTGATLATTAQEGSAFGYLRERLGIEDAAESQYGSPFDYERNCRIYLPTDVLDADDHEHNESVARAIRMLAEAAGGRTMVLFRSYSAMNQVHRRIKDDLEQAGLVLLRQGRDGTAANIVEALRNDPKLVAFGVAALWTGVDIPGDALSLLIMTRLPFVPPNDPVLKARGEQYNNEFMEFSLPAAILQFRQGIGRLIRTQSDRGAAVILDGRISSRRYGRHFLDALPPAPVIREPINRVAEDIAQFLPKAGAGS